MSRSRSSASQSEAATDDRTEITLPEWVPLADSELAAPTLIAALGVAPLTIAVLHLLSRVRRPSVRDLPPTFLVVLALSAGLMYASYRLRQSPFQPPEQWIVAASSLAGSLLVPSMRALTTGFPVVGGGSVGDPAFGLVATAGGAVAGLLVGVTYVQARRDAGA